MPPTRLGSIDLNLLVALDALLSETSVTRAAARLGLSQPAMSHALNRLRALFDDPLLVRTTRGMTLTPRAQQLVEPLREALGRLESVLERRQAFEPATARRTFTVATLDYASLLLLPPLMTRLSEEAPGIDLVVRAVHEDAGALLEAGEVDLSLAVPRPEMPGIYQQKLFEDRFVCLVRKEHPAVKRSLTLEQYVGLPHILISPQHGRGAAGPVDAALARQGLQRRIALRVPHFLVAPLIVARSDLLLTVPERIARTFTELLPLRALPPPLELPGPTMMQHCTSGTTMTPRTCGCGESWPRWPERCSPRPPSPHPTAPDPGGLGRNSAHARTGWGGYFCGSSEQRMNVDVFVCT